MMKHGTIHRSRLQKLVVLLVSLLLIWLPWGCTDDSRMPRETTGTTSVSNSDTAPASLTIRWHDAPKLSAAVSFQAAALDCQTSSVENVVCKVYDASGNWLVTGGPWPCAAKSGRLDRVPVGQGHIFVVLAEDANGDVLYHGETSGITVEAGSAAQSVVVDAFPFIPALTSPEDNAQIDLANLSLEWNPLENADEYLVQVAEDIDFQTIVVDETTPAAAYAPTGLAPSTTYFWKISAIDSHTNVSAASEIRTFSTSDAPASVISGKVQTSDGAGISAVVVTFSNGAGTATTDAAGVFSKAVPYGWSGSATPSKVGWQFLPESIPYQNVTSNLADQNFTGATLTAVISGAVRTSTGDAIDGVTLTVSNGGGTVTTDTSGAYSIAVPQGWSGSVTPSKQGWTFTPTSNPYQNVIADMDQQNYTGTAIQPRISGYVRTSNGTGIEGVTLTLGNGGGTDTTDASGAYSERVPYGWSGSATPSKRGWNFEPTSTPYSNVTVNQAGQNYTGTPIRLVISGVVTQDTTGEGIGDVTISFSDGSTVTTGASGAYSKTVSYGWDGSATPSKRGWNFMPATIPYTNVTADQVDQNYTGTPVMPVISGYVRDPAGNGVSGITLSFSGSGSVTTDNSGAYRKALSYDWSGSVTPTTAGFVYSPTSINYTSVTADQSGQDFTATPIRPIISGHIKTNFGHPLTGIIVTFSNNGGTTSTNNDGSYTKDLPYGWSGTAQPSLGTWQFAPPERRYNSVTTDRPNEDYTGRIFLIN